MSVILFVRVKSELDFEITLLENEKADLRLQGILDLKKILTTEQQEKFQKLMEEDRAKRKDHWKERKEHRGKSDKMRGERHGDRETR